ncbi:hypothetical protein EDD85DRAFT_793619 [Armillaria nabsnona]|nr:hypothetical protein EDD85DRAFT_793619 [Armillaria nabsnona]
MSRRLQRGQQEKAVHGRIVCSHQEGRIQLSTRASYGTGGKRKPSTTNPRAQTLPGWLIRECDFVFVWIPERKDRVENTKCLLPTKFISKILRAQIRPKNLGPRYTTGTSSSVVLDIAGGSDILIRFCTSAAPANKERSLRARHSEAKSWLRPVEMDSGLIMQSPTPVVLTDRLPTTFNFTVEAILLDSLLPAMRVLHRQRHTESGKLPFELPLH